MKMRAVVATGLLATACATGIAAATTPKHKPKKHKPAPAKAAPKPAAKANDAQWTEFGHDDQSTKYVVSTAITKKTVGNLRQQWTVTLDGTVVAQPLYYDGVVYAASEGGDIVAIDAASGAPIWKQTTDTVDVPGECGTWGISSTPVIDPSTGRIYVASAAGYIHAFDLDTGGEQPGFPFKFVDSSATDYAFGALRLFGSNILVGVSSHCDESTPGGDFATGQLAAYDVASDPGNETGIFQTVPQASRLGGIWGFSGATISTDGKSIYTGVGNADGIDPGCSCEHDDWGYGDSLVQLGSDLSVVGSNDPAIASDGEDLDWGAAPALFDPAGCQPLAVASNKDGYVYAYRQNAIGNGPIWMLAIGTGEPPLLDGPAWSPSTQMFYVAGARMPFNRSQPASGVGIVAVKVSAKCKLSVAWTAQTGAGDGDYGSQPPPIVVGNLVFASGGNGGVVALDASTGKELWSADTNGTTLASPSEAGGMLFPPDGSNVVGWSTG